MAGDRGSTSRRVIEILEKQRRALQMRRGGASLDEIAQRLGYAGHTSARKAIITALKRNEVADVDALRAQELDRLDRMWAAVWPDIIGPESGAAQRNFAIDRCIRIVDRENGLDEEQAVAEARRYLREARGA
jgi:SOS-response transcriptional repressor LexA